MEEVRNPMQAAQRLARPERVRRFYERVEMSPEEGGFALRLDGKRAMTPRRKPLVLPERLRAAVEAEWARQGEFVDPSSMPATRLANSALDGVAARPQEVRDSILAYAGTDLVCYRAGEPEGLVARQSKAWDPLLAWAEKRFQARLVLAEGIVHAAQPETTLAAVAAALAAIDDPFRLAGLHLATTLTGSAIIALALGEGAVSADGAWDAAHVDEDWNIAQWGADAEAMRRRELRREDFDAAVLALAPDAPGV
jgi:chaperone required for assembly of F1-ATPase